MTAMAGRNRRSLMYNLGAFFGNIARGLTSDLAESGAARRQVVRRDVHEHARQTPQGIVTLRRTTIEEIEVRPSAPGGDDGDAPHTP